MSATRHSKSMRGQRRVWAAVAAAALVIAGCGSDDAANDSDASVTAPTEAPAGDDGAAAGDGAVAAAIAGFAFDPSSMRVVNGDTVTWTNTDSATHTVTATGDLAFDSGNLAEGESFTLTVDQPGEFTYICTIHRSMQGTIVVT